MGEIRFVGTGETHGYPYLVCKKSRANSSALANASAQSVLQFAKIIM